MSHHNNLKSNTRSIASLLLVMVLIPMLSVQIFAATEAEEIAKAAKIIGPLKYDNNCSSCHALEAEAWKQTTHFATFKSRGRTPQAKAILEKMGQRSMKSAGACRQCHYTSKLKGTRLKSAWGISCESCHSPASDWFDVHNKQGGDPTAKAMEMGTGKDQPAESKQKRIAAAQKMGMIHSAMIYDIASNCFSCHTVPNEEMVNKGGHHAGSDFDLVAWSQGEIRHNFLDTAATAAPKNRKSSPNQLRRLYVIGAMVDLETTLKNITIVTAKGGVFHKAMVARANKIRDKVQAILDAQPIEELAAAISDVPKTIDESTAIDAALPEKLKAASLAFLKKHDGSTLTAIDALLPAEKDYKGTAHQQ
ncbi:MAG: hypothetical protein JKX85_11350 [Phycisphaeraceae bacterium]|nr:hypothetical protein [Phycisphaeraceae bacterium]